jgi:hypothetical protein
VTITHGGEIPQLVRDRLYRVTEKYRNIWPAKSAATLAFQSRRPNNAVLPLGCGIHAKHAFLLYRSRALPLESSCQATRFGSVKRRCGKNLPFSASSCPVKPRLKAHKLGTQYLFRSSDVVIASYFPISTRGLLKYFTNPTWILR